MTLKFNHSSNFGESFGLSSKRQEEISNVLSELSNIQNAINNLQKEFDLINNAIKNSRLILHQMDNYDDLA